MAIFGQLQSIHNKSLMQKRYQLYGFFFILPFLLVSCQIWGSAQPTITAAITVDGKTTNLVLPKGSTVENALKSAGVTLNPLDRVDPLVGTQLTTSMNVNVVRVREEITTLEKTIPYDHQTVKNEALPAGETRLIEPGVNGTEKVTTRKVFEDGLPVDDVVLERTIIQAAVPEIIMVGIQNPFTPMKIPGKLAYLDSGNAWIIEQETSKRILLVSTADLDGRIFSLSPDGGWLLFSRKSSAGEKNTINSLWVIQTDESSKPIDLSVHNVVRYAGWVPGLSTTISYSTVEPRDSAPGWQSNNDLYTLSFTNSGTVHQPEKILEANSGGVYGWWGYTFIWSPDGSQIAYAGTDTIGLVNRKDKTLAPLVKFTPYQTHADWAWVPEIDWTPDGQFILTTLHGLDNSLPAAESSQDFSLAAVPVDGSKPIYLISRSGMFANPRASSISNKTDYQAAYLQSIFPDQSETSRYRLVVMDRDGSNRTTIFPEEGATGLNPQHYAWSPVADNTTSSFIALTYQGNLWIVSRSDQKRYQITGDGLTEQVDW